MKTDKELIEEFFAKGGKIEKIENIEYIAKNTIGSTSKKTPILMTLPEGEEKFGEKQDRIKKEKEPDYSDINMDLIPENLRMLLNKNPKQI